MKRFFSISLLLLCMVTLYAQSIEFQELVPYKELPKEYKKKHTVFKGTVGDLFICDFKTTSSVPASEIVLVDKHLNLVKHVTLPDEYNKFSASYLGKLGNHYIISIYKGLNKRFLGLMDENWQLVKTLPIQKGFVFEKVLYTDDTYAYIQVEGWKIIKIDEQFNIVQSNRTQEFINTFAFQYTVKEKDGKIYLRLHGFQPSMYNLPSITRYIYCFDKETLRETKIDMFEHNGAKDYRVYFGEDVIACVDLSRGHARIFDYNGLLLQEKAFPAKDYTNKIEYTNRPFWNSVNEELIIANMLKKSVNNKTNITLFHLDRNHTQTTTLTNVEIAGEAQMDILDFDNNDLRLFVGIEHGFRILDVDLQSAAYRTLFEKECDLDFEYANITKNDAGYIICTYRSKLASTSSNKIDYYSYNQSHIFIAKDFSNATCYNYQNKARASYTMDRIIHDNTYHDFVLIRHSESLYSRNGTPLMAYDLKYNLIDKFGNQTTINTDILHGSHPMVYKLSPTEYFVYTLVKGSNGKTEHKAGILKITY